MGQVSSTPVRARTQRPAAKLLHQRPAYDYDPDNNAGRYQGRPLLIAGFKPQQRKETPKKAVIKKPRRARKAAVKPKQAYVKTQYPYGLRKAAPGSKPGKAAVKPKQASVKTKYPYGLRKAAPGSKPGKAAVKPKQASAKTKYPYGLRKAAPGSKPGKAAVKPKQASVTPKAKVSTDGVRYAVIYPGHDEYERQAAFIRANVGKMCKGHVSRTWVTQDSLRHADALVLAYTESSTRRGVRWDVKGFAILRISPLQVYVDLICAKGFGSKILRAIEDEARNLGKRYFSLSALPHVINYYRRLGFVHAKGSACKEDAEIGRAADGVDDMQFGNGDEAVSDRKFARFLNLLVQKGYNSDKHCKSIGFDKDGCGTHGYRMRKCL